VSKGFGYITFAKPDMADRCVRDGPHFIGRFPMEVKFAHNNPTNIRIRGRSDERDYDARPNRPRSRSRSGTGNRETDHGHRPESEKRIIRMKTSDDEDEGDAKDMTTVCPFCQKLFANLQKLDGHMTWTHANIMFNCDLCQKFYAWSRERLQQHLQTQHKENVSMAQLMKNFTIIPKKLHRINCKLCPPPNILGSEGFWLASNIPSKMTDILGHFSSKHLITGLAPVNSQLELACRGCDATFSHAECHDWLSHIEMNHTRILEPDLRHSGGRRKVSGDKHGGKKCDYCNKSVIATDSIRHVKEVHAKETFLCKICHEADPSCFPFADTMKEIMRHMVLKHGKDFSSYYELIIYPKNLGWTRCTAKGCEVSGKYQACNQELSEEHTFFYHPGVELTAIHCRLCEGVKEQFQNQQQLEEHLRKRRKQILPWKAKNGN
jgi:hypothetical protein